MARRTTAKEITQPEDRALMIGAVHTQHKDCDKIIASIPRERRTHTLKKKVIVPVEETVKVPVIRKETRQKVDRVVVKGNKLMPITKYKEIEETVLEVQKEIVNGRVEKRATPVTTTRYQPYTDYESKEVDVVVEVPKEEVITRKGYRLDRHVVSKVFEVDQDVVYEMRPVVVERGEKTITDLGMHHKYKVEHGLPVWDAAPEGGWTPRPRTPEHRPELPRPSSARSIRSDTNSLVVPALKKEKRESDGVIVGVSAVKYVRPKSAVRIAQALDALADTPRVAGPPGAALLRNRPYSGSKWNSSRSATRAMPLQRSGMGISGSLNDYLTQGTLANHHLPTFGT